MRLRLEFHLQAVLAPDRLKAGLQTVVKNL